MPLIVNGVQGGSVWQKCEEPRRTAQTRDWGVLKKPVELALINNMPDLALEDTELQFFELLENASDDLEVHLRLFSLPNIPRSEQAQKRLSSAYFGINDLWRQPFDAVIITGTEPRKADLRQEPYWPALVDVLDWAEENTASTVLSCLAAHAAVLHGDGIRRQLLNEKQFGVFEVRAAGESMLIARIGDTLRCPHSRWNELSEDALISCGYTVLTHSEHAGVDLFIKKKADSLFVYFQGHPEYGALTLLKEYRRDARRFLRGERETYPSMPFGYFDAATTAILREFQRCAVARPGEELMVQFPTAFAAQSLRNTWQETGTCIYRNWLTYVASKKVRTPIFPGICATIHPHHVAVTQEPA
jgi:homoserine O-succinyltransferase/O-acetyltransferase